MIHIGFCFCYDVVNRKHKRMFRIGRKVKFPLPIKQFEGKLKTEGIETSIDGTHKCTYIKYVRTYSITQFYIWIQMGHKQYTCLQPFLLNHPQPTV